MSACPLSIDSPPALPPESDLASDHLVRIYPHTLGRFAVDADLERVDAILTDDTIGPDYIHLYTKHVRGQIRKVVKKYGSSDVSTALLEVKEMPTWLRNATISADDPTTLATNLTNKDKVSDATFLNVLQWRLGQLANKQAAYEQRDLPNIRTQFERGMNEAYRRGWMPAVALGRMGHLRTIPTYVDDGFQTSAQRLSGFATFANDKCIVIAPHRRTSQNTYNHEGSHMLEGVDEVPEGARNGQRESRGLNRIFRTRFGDVPKALNEALTERIAEALISGDIDTFLDPKDVKHYVVQQMLLKTLCEDGVAPVDIRLFINAYYEDGIVRDKLGDRSAAAQLVAALQQAFPRRDIMSDLSYLSDKEKSIIRFTRKLQQEGQKGPLTPREVRQYRWTKPRRPIGSY